MTDALGMVLALVTGGLLGGLFFGGLWWTVHKLVTSKHPALWVLSSMLLRTCLTLAGFYLVARGDWERLVACLFGFVIARLLVIRLARVPEDTTHLSKAVSHAP